MAIEPGNVYAFELEDGSYSACRVLRIAKATAVVAGSTYIGKQIPDIACPELLKVVTLTHHSHRGALLIRHVSKRVPRMMTLIGNIPVSKDHAEIECVTYCFWEAIPYQCLAQWLWDLEEEGTAAADKVRKACLRRIKTRADAARKAYLAAVTPEELAKKRYFQAWGEGYPRKAITASRKAARDAGQRLVDLGPKASVAKRKQALVEFVEELNEIDADYQFIDTKLSEDIYSELEAMAHAGKLVKHVGTIFKLREW